MTSQDCKRLCVLMGPSIFNLGTKKSQEISKSDFMELLSNDPRVIEATNSMIASTEGKCPPEENMYPKDPPLGDVKFAIDNWRKQPESIKEAIRAFLNVVMDTSQFKSLSVSKNRLKHGWSLKFGIIAKKGPSTQPIPGQAGQHYVGQHVPAQSYIRHETEKQGNAKIVSNLSEETGKGDLILPAHPDTYCANQAVPLITSLHEAMTDQSTAACYPHQLQEQTQEAPRIGEADTKVMKEHPTELASHQEMKKMTRGLKRKGVGIPAYSSKETKLSIYDKKLPETNELKSRNLPLSDKLAKALDDLSGRGRSVEDEKYTGDYKGTKEEDTVKDELEGMPMLEVKGTDSTAEGDELIDIYARLKAGGHTGTPSEILELRELRKTTGRSDIELHDVVRANLDFEEDEEKPMTFHSSTTRSGKSYQRGLKSYNSGEKASKKGKKLNLATSKVASKLGDSAISENPDFAILLTNTAAEYLVDNQPKTEQEAMGVLGFAKYAWSSVPKVLRSLITNYGRKYFTDVALHTAGTLAGAVGGPIGIAVGNVAAELASNAIEEVFNYVGGDETAIQGQTSVVSNQQIQSGGNATSGAGPGAVAATNNDTPSSTPATSQTSAFSTIPVKADDASKASKIGESTINQNVRAIKENNVNVKDAVKQGTTESNQALKNSQITVGTHETTSSSISDPYSKDEFSQRVNFYDGLDYSGNVGQYSWTGKKYRFDKVSLGMVKKRDTLSSYYDKFNNSVTEFYYGKNKKVNARRFQGGKEKFNDLELNGLDSETVGKLSTDYAQQQYAHRQGISTRSKLGLRHREGDYNGGGWSKFTEGGFYKNQGTKISGQKIQEKTISDAGQGMELPGRKLQGKLQDKITYDIAAAELPFTVRDEKQEKNGHRSFGNVEYQWLPALNMYIRRSRYSEISKWVKNTYEKKDQKTKQALRDDVLEREQLAYSKIAERFDLLDDKAPNPYIAHLDPTLYDLKDFKEEKDGKEEGEDEDIKVAKNPDDRRLTVIKTINAKKGRYKQLGGMSDFKGVPRLPGQSSDKNLAENKYPTANSEEDVNGIKENEEGAKRAAAGGNENAKDFMNERDSKAKGASIKSVDENGNRTDLSSSATADLKNDPRSNLIAVEANENMLRPSFTEGGANEVSKLNNDPILQLIDRLEWQAFNNYTWEANEESDNILKGMNLVDDYRRFKGLNDQEELMDTMANDANNESFNTKMEAFAIPDDMIKDVTEEMWDIIPPPYTIEGPISVENAFHDVYLPDWHSMPDSNPWKQMTQINGTQLPDTQLKNSGRVMGNDWSSGKWENDYLGWTLA